MKTQVTVIIPAYNAEKTIGATIASLKAQTIPVDIIVVDDGSKQPLELEDVRVIRQENQGAYMARLTGVREVKTKYIGFVDADDTVEPTMYEKLVTFAEAHQLDMAQCDREGDENVGKRPELFLSYEEVQKNVILPRIVRGENAMNVWNRIYKKDPCFSRVNEFRPSNILMFEDLAINCQVIGSLMRVGYLHEALYHYNVNEGSSVRNFRLKNVLDLREIIRFRDETLPMFGMTKNDSVRLLWIRKNVRNMFVVASSARCGSWSERMENVRALYEVLKENGGAVPRFLQLRVAIVFFMKRLQMSLRNQ